VCKPTRLEENFTAELIRENWHDQKRRPRWGFRRPILVSSLDDPDDSHVAALWEKLNGAESDDENEERVGSAAPPTNSSVRRAWPVAGRLVFSGL
jgi:hypothetical protein